MLPVDPRSLIDAKLLGKLDQLELLTHRVFRGRQKGERRSRKKGVSIEFADYRDYSRGDDTRHLDWNIYGRLERLFIKMYQEEEDLAFYVLLDTSESMNFGEPVTKFDYARRLAAALGYIALRNQDKLGGLAFASRGGAAFRPVRGKGQVPKFLNYLAQLEPKDRTSLKGACKDFVLQNKQSGIVVLISDFLDEAGYEDALKHFFARNYEVYCIHVLSREEREPKLGGHLELVDAETGEKQEVTINGALIEQYKQTVEAFCRSIRDWCSSRGMTYIATTPEEPIEQMLLNALRYRGMLR